MTAGATATDTDGRLPEAAAAFRSPLRYPGGKQKAIASIAAMLPAEAVEYREPMVGGGSVFFHARKCNFASKYWINDQFADLIAFWRTVQNGETAGKLVSDLERLRARFSGPEEIKRYFLAARLEEPEDEYRRALLFFFFNRVTFSGTTRAGGFSASASMLRFTASSIKRLAAMEQALKDVSITSRDFEEVITAPGDGVFLFLDPPYFTASRLYGRKGSLHDFDHERLAELLKGSAHKFLMTYDDCEEVRRLYGWAHISEWRLQYGMNNCNSDNLSKIGCELFIKNY